MRVKEIMSSPAIYIRSDASPKEAVSILRTNDIGALPVVDENQELVGIISEADLIKLGTEADPVRHLAPLPSRYPAHAAASVGDLMTKKVITIEEGEDAASAARLMLEHDVRQLPVVSAGRLVGVVARRDLIKVLARTDDQIKAELEKIFREENAFLCSCTVEVKEGRVFLCGPLDQTDRRLAEIVAQGVPGVIDVEFVGD
ncbi:MAG: CBS domain-containing protein [Actinomycetota bacterium]